VLLTGATGFFGAHLVRALLQRGAEEIVCLVRGGEERVFDALTWYFGQGWTAGIKNRVRAVSGDLTAPLLGLGQDAYYALARDVDSVYHAAADVRHFVKNEQELVHNNVAATRAMIEFALAADAPLHAMSTLSVCGEYMIDSPGKRCVFTERDFSFGQNWQENGYVRSKMLSEAAIYDAMTNRGLRAKVYRLGRLVWRAEDGVFQRNPRDNMTALLSSAVAALGAFPKDLAMRTMDMTCVDVAAEAVAALANCRLTTLHVMNSDAVNAGELFSHAIPGLQILEGEEFDRILSRRMIDEQSGRWALLSEYVRMQRLHGEKITTLNLMTQAAMAAEGLECTFPDVEKMGHDLAAVLGKMAD
jgi:thioester reductase-like protein